MANSVYSEAVIGKCNKGSSADSVLARQRSHCANIAVRIGQTIIGQTLVALHFTTATIDDILKVNGQTMQSIDRKGFDRKSAGYGSHVQWPSISSVLETPERKRSRRSTSFADSGLGSSLFGSPPSKAINISVTVPALKTPTRRKSNTSSPSSQSPLKQIMPDTRELNSFTLDSRRSFLHVSAYSESFSPPESCSPPSRFRLSNPGKANCIKYLLFYCAISRISIQWSQYTENGSADKSSYDDENDDGILDCTSSYVKVETPSKAFSNDMSLSTSFFDDSYSYLTSTPMNSSDDVLQSTSIIPSHYTIPEQANGPLESSLCEPFDQFRLPDTDFMFPMMSTDTESLVLPVTRISPQERKINLINPELVGDFVSGIPTRLCLRETNCNNKPFKPPKKTLRVNSKKWFQITCGKTPHQVGSFF
ncbi:unnamed protein product [Thelazia callipaeda]|uniref:PDZ domain-containing protein n=1 Tax=Thelazia callipaeda TaxID=103827 RepID=A0A158RAP7_THECL|nr:unnamed protein product [Thelazia callipaeda]